MSYEVLFITKGGVTLDIPLCDSLTTLMTLQLHYINFYITYDCFHSTNDIWNFTNIMFAIIINFHTYPCGTKIDLI